MSQEYEGVRRPRRPEHHVTRHAKPRQQYHAFASSSNLLTRYACGILFSGRTRAPLVRARHEMRVLSSKHASIRPSCIQAPPRMPSLPQPSSARRHIERQFAPAVRLVTASVANRTRSIRQASLAQGRQQRSNELSASLKTSEAIGSHPQPSILSVHALRIAGVTYRPVTSSIEARKSSTRHTAATTSVAACHASNFNLICDIVCTCIATASPTRQPASRYRPMNDHIWRSIIMDM